MTSPAASDLLPSQDVALRRLFLTLFLRGRSTRGLRKDRAPRSIGARLGWIMAIYALVGCSAFIFWGEPVFAPGRTYVVPDPSPGRCHRTRRAGRPVPVRLPLTAAAALTAAGISPNTPKTKGVPVQPGRLGITAALTTRGLEVELHPPLERARCSEREHAGAVSDYVGTPANWIYQ